MEQNRDAITKPAKLQQLNDAIIFFSVPSIYYEMVGCSTFVRVFGHQEDINRCTTIKPDKIVVYNLFSFEHSAAMPFTLNVAATSDVAQSLEKPLITRMTESCTRL